MIRLDDVRVFLEIVAGGSMTNAAHTLGHPKSTIGRQLARLEDELGCQLLSRTSRTVMLTDRGATFLPRARQLVDDAAEAEGLVREDGHGAHGRVRISTPTTFGTFFLAPLLPIFMQRYPRISIELSLNSRKVALGPEEGAADLAVRLGPLVEDNLRVHRLGEIDFALVASPAYLAGRTQPQCPSDLGRHDLIALQPRHVGDQFTLRNNDATQSITWPARMIVDDPQALRAVILAGGGVANLPIFMIERDLADGSLVRLLPGWQSDPNPVKLVYAGNRQPPLRLTALVEFLLETLGRDQPWQSAESRKQARES